MRRCTSIQILPLGSLRNVACVHHHLNLSTKNVIKAEKAFIWYRFAHSRSTKCSLFYHSFGCTSNLRSELQNDYIWSLFISGTKSGSTTSIRQNSSIAQSRTIEASASEGKNENWASVEQRQAYATVLGKTNPENKNNSFQTGHRSNKKGKRFSKKNPLGTESVVEEMFDDAIIKREDTKLFANSKRYGTKQRDDNIATSTESSPSDEMQRDKSGLVDEDNIEEHWATVDERRAYTQDVLSELEIGNENFESVVQELISRLFAQGRSITSIAEEWIVGKNYRLFRPVMYFLLSRNCNRIALRLFEAAFSALRYPDRHELFVRELKKSASGMIVFVHFLQKLNLAKIQLQPGDISIFNWAERLVKLSVLIRKHNISVCLKATRLKHLMTTSKPEEMLLLYRYLQELNLPLYQDVDIAFIFLFARNGFFADAFNILRKLETTPDNFDTANRLWSYRELLFRIYRAGVPIHTSNLLELLLSYRELIDDRIYHMFLYSAVKAGDAQTAFALFQDIKMVTGTEANIFTYTSMYNMYRKNGDREGMKKIHLSAIDEGLEPHKDTAFVNSMLHAESCEEWSTYSRLYARYQEFFPTAPLDALHMQKGLAPIRTLKPSDLLEPDEITIAIMLHVFFKDKSIDHTDRPWAWFLYQQYLRNLADPRSLPVFDSANEYVFGIFITALGMNRSDLARAVAVVEDMSASSLLPNPTLISWNPLLRSFARHGDVSGAEKIWAIIGKRQFIPNTYSYNAMMMVYTKVGNDMQAGRWLARMKKNGWEGNALTKVTIHKAQDHDAMMQGFREECDVLQMEELKQMSLNEVQTNIGDAL